MKILYLTDTDRYQYHKELAGEFLEITGGEVMDIPDDGNRQMKFFDVKNAAADVIITFDGTGLDFRTVSDTLSLNNLYARMAHILFHKPSFYEQKILIRQNLSMFTYIPNNEDPASFSGKYEDIPNVRLFGEFSYKPYNDEEKKMNRETIRAWWDDFKKEAML